MYRDFDIVLAPGDRTTEFACATFFTIKSSNQPLFGAGINGDSPRKCHQGFYGGPFPEKIERIEFVNNSLTENLILSGYHADGPVGDSSVVIDSSGAALPVSLASVPDNEVPKYLKSIDDPVIAGGGATSILPDLSTRVEAFICNMSTTVTARISSDGTVPTVNRGIPCVPGQTVIIDVQDEIQAYNPSGAAMTFAVSYTERA